MNANELADELEKRHLLGGYASEAATMLRQQQAEIEALKAAKIRAYDNGVEDGRKPDTNNKPVAWMIDTLDGKHLMLYGSNPPPVFNSEVNAIPLYAHPVEEKKYSDEWWKSVAEFNKKAQEK